MKDVGHSFLLHCVHHTFESKYDQMEQNLENIYLD